MADVTRLTSIMKICFEGEGWVVTKKKTIRGPPGMLEL
jgi:hypothetical protein